jgi:conjugal transfer/entry exclusion protein
MRHLSMMQKMLRQNQELNQQMLTSQTELMSKMIGILAVKDPLAFQQIQAMEQTLSPEYDEDSVSMSEIDLALREAQQTGRPVYDGESLDGGTYDTDNIASFWLESDGSAFTGGSFTGRD